MACLARLDGEPIHEVVERAIATLDLLEHRGAAGADAETGDGAGILIQLPHDFIRERASEFGVTAEHVPEPGSLAIAMCFLPADDERRTEIRTLIENTVKAEGQIPLGWREVETDQTQCGTVAREAMPTIRQLMIGRGPSTEDADAFERKLFVIRRIIELQTSEVTFPSFSARTIVYKGMLTAPQLARFYPDLRDPALTSALAIVHSRFSTNTFPSWGLAHPHRMSAHNGEINTLQGNVNWMQAREAILESDLFGDDLKRCLPLVTPGTSDSLAFDHVFEMLCLAGRSLPHAAMMMIPRAHENRSDVPDEIEGFYHYHSRLIEPWDGPAAITFTDGTFLGATLDRNGLRPGRWVVTHDGWVAVSSEAGSFQVPDENVKYRGRLRPGSMFAIDLAQGRVLDEGEAESVVASAAPWREWDEARTVHLDDLPREAALPPREPPSDEKLLRYQLAFGYSQEDLRLVLTPMARDAKEPTGSMGNDLALAMFSEQAPSLFSYFKQRFAQVTNPAIDSVREHIVMSLRTGLGPESNLLFGGARPAMQLVLDRPVLTNDEMALVRELRWGGLETRVLDMTFAIRDGDLGMEGALDRLLADASQAIREGASILVLSDRAVNEELAAIPSLLATSAVHQHLVRTGDRVGAGLAVETGEAREVHHIAALIGYGASAVNPYLMLDTVRDLAVRGEVADIDPRYGGGAHREGPRNGPPQGALEDGDLDDLFLQRGPDLRGGGARKAPRRPALHRHVVLDRRGRLPADRPRGAAAPRAGLAGGARPQQGAPRRAGAAAGGARRPSASGRRLRVASRRRAPHVGSGDDLDPSARHDRQRRRRRPLLGLQGARE